VSIQVSKRNNVAVGQSTRTENGVGTRRVGHNAAGPRHCIPNTCSLKVLQFPLFGKRRRIQFLVKQLEPYSDYITRILTSVGDSPKVANESHSAPPSFARGRLGPPALDIIVFHNSSPYIQRHDTILMKHRVSRKLLSKLPGPPLYGHTRLHNGPRA